MYEEYYGFTEKPFSLTPDPKYLYRSESHGNAFDLLQYAIRRREGFVVVTGDIGTGKTTLCRTLLEQFDQTTFTALILNPFLSVEELLREVLLSFGVVSRDALKSGRLATASKHELIRTLHDFLLSLVPLHGNAVLIIDEAQHLSTDVLEEIRILSNLETNDQKLLQIVIVGQLNLLDLLHKTELRQLEQRISIRCSLKALTREEVEAYVTHRLWVARGSTPVSFTPKAFDLVHTVTGGVPRMINLLCDRALMVACGAQISRLTEEQVVQSAAQIGLEVPEAMGERSAAATQSSNRSWVLAALLVLAAAGGATYYFLGNPIELFSGAERPAVRRAPPRPLPARVAALAVPAGLPEIGPPPAVAGSFSVLVGTFDTVRQVDQLEAELRAQRLPVYLIDVLVAPGDLQRRVLVGRYSSREEADAVRQKLGPAMNAARVIPGAVERLRTVP